MKLLYFSMSCNVKHWETIQSTSKVKASAAPHVFDTSIIKGLFSSDDVQLEIYSFPPVATYPGSKRIFFFAKKEEIFAGCFTRWLPFLNLPFLKQISLFLSTLIFCLVWLLKHFNAKDKQIVMYTTYFPVALPIVFLGNLFKCKCTAIITDVPQYLFLNQKKSFAKLSFLYSLYERLMNYAQKGFDKFVFLTAEMNRLINRENKPHVVVEGVCDPSLFKKFALEEKSNKKAIMYAGALNEKLGLPLLLEVFSEMQDIDVELWLFGSGDYEIEIAAAARKDHRIKFFGRESRETVLKFERRAWLLINLRDPNEDFTRYSFPSKTIEYMCSGTPLLTTKLPGIPVEYFEYLYTIDSIENEVIKSHITKILKKSFSELKKFGEKASDFVKVNKNYSVQTGKILKLLRSEI